MEREAAGERSAAGKHDAGWRDVPKRIARSLGSNLWHGEARLTPGALATAGGCGIKLRDPQANVGQYAVDNVLDKLLTESHQAVARR